MHFLSMEGGWGRLSGWLYERVVAAGVGDLYDRFAEEVAGRVPEGSAVVDVGCGQGQVSSRLARQMPDSTVLGLDLSVDMIERAISRCPPLENLEFRQGDAMDLPLADETMDVALSIASIKHWPSRLKGVSEMVRVVKSGGSLCVLEADRDCSLASAARFADMWAHLLPGSSFLEARYFRRFVAGQALNLDELVGVMTRAGVVDLEARRLIDLPFVVAWAHSP